MRRFIAEIWKKCAGLHLAPLVFFDSFGLNLLQLDTDVPQASSILSFVCEACGEFPDPRLRGGIGSDGLLQLFLKRGNILLTVDDL